MTPYGDTFWVNIGLGNGVLPAPVLTWFCVTKTSVTGSGQNTNQLIWVEWYTF